MPHFGLSRRDFIKASIAAAALPGSLASAQTATRAAVVIGVNRSGGLPKLNAAVSGAREVRGWLAQEGFEVVPFLDEDAAGRHTPVRVDAIFQAVKALVDRGTLQQLVVYFSGHGVNISFSEVWLLSDAPDNPNQAIRLPECVALARQTGIPNVVFISDACRSTAQSLQAQLVHGQLIFPNRRRPPDRRVQVDRFYAALPGHPAFELDVGDSVKRFAGVFTSVLLDAFKFPDDAMVTKVRGVEVVRNRHLRNYLTREVTARLAKKSIQLEQSPDAQVESDAYLGRVVRPADPVSVDPRVGGPPAATISDVAGGALERVGLVVQPGWHAVPQGDLATLANTTGFVTVQNTILAASTRTDLPTHFETMTGATVHGARVERAMMLPGMWGEILDHGNGDDQPAILRYGSSGGSPPNEPGSVVLTFADGSGTVIPILPQFLATVVVKEHGVSDVRYVPSDTSHLWSAYRSRTSEIAEMHATVATAAKFGVFRFDVSSKEARESARELAHRIRMHKGIDPSLGLYAAYAYADVGSFDQVESVHNIMRMSLDAGLFDVAMLAGAISRGPFVPFCPMLSQGWGLLRVNGVDLPPPLVVANDHRRAALWTTFDGEGMGHVEAFAQSQPHAMAHG